MTETSATKQLNVDATIDEALTHSVQQTTPHSFGSIGLLRWLTTVGDLLPPWWSKARDLELRNFWKRPAPVAGAVYTLQTKLSTIPFEVRAKDRSIQSHVKQAAEFTDRLTGASLGRGGEVGWAAFVEPFLEDLLTQDNGAWAEIIGPGRPDGPLTGAPIALRHLDSFRIDRTGDTEYPALYSPRGGGQFKLHNTRVLYKAQMPSSDEDMLGVGVCAVSRCVDMAQTFVDMATYKQEKFGSRPPRQFLLGKGISLDEMLSAVRLAGEQLDSAELTRFANTVFLGADNPDVDLQQIDFASLPDHFDEMQQFQIGMALVALAFGVDVRDLAWSMGVAGQTRADAMVQHLKARGKAVGNLVRLLEDLIGYKFLPAHLALVFDYQDDEQDQLQAEIREKRATTIKTTLETQVVTPRVARIQLRQAGDLDEAEFEELELDDGRLPDGVPVVALFHQAERDARLAELLDVGVDDPLDVGANDPDEILSAIAGARRRAEAAWINGSTANIRRTAQQAAAALEALRKLYAEAEGPQRAGQPDEPASAADRRPGEEEEEEVVAPSGDDDELPVPFDDPPEEVKALTRLGAHAGGIHYEEPCSWCGRWIEAGDADLVKGLFDDDAWRLVCRDHELEAETTKVVPA